LLNTIERGQVTGLPAGCDRILLVNVIFSEDRSVTGPPAGKACGGGLYTFVGKRPDSFSVGLNGTLIRAVPKNGYVDVARTWKDGDRLELDLPMDVRAVVADSRVKADSAKVALQRGPLVYCLEGPDNPGENVLNLRVDPRQQFITSFKPDLLGGITVIGGQAVKASHTAAAGADHSSSRFTAIPYYTWANRGSHDMTVWISRQGSAHRALPAPATAAADEAWASVSRKSTYPRL
jgi:hypothetical protein